MHSMPTMESSIKKNETMVYVISKNSNSNRAGTSTETNNSDGAKRENYC